MTPHHRINIPGRPYAFARPATVLSRNGRAYRRTTPAGYRTWKDNAAGVVNMGRGGLHLDGPIAVEIQVHPDGTQATIIDLTGQHTRPRGVTGDLDNYAKAVLDALVDGNLIADDRQVQALTVRFNPQPMEGNQ